jgi:LmbE family N-acetylglucosaminyl deacetylase
MNDNQTSDNEIIRQISTSKKVCYFISPHFDDVVLSAGALAAELAKTNTVIVINVFTKAGQHPYTLSAKSFLKQCGYTDAEALYTERTSEDIVALEGITSTIHNLNYSEALWRAKQGIVGKTFGRLLPELKVLYPTYRFHVITGKLAKQDKKTLVALRADLTKLITAKNKVIFCPRAIGNHIDHVITRDACENLFDQVIEWTDYPYSLQEATNQPTASDQTFNFEDGINDKYLRITRYKTQFKAMFGEHVPTLSAEQYRIIDKSL